METNGKIHRRLAFGPFQMDVTDRTLFRGKKPVQIAPKLFDTLRFLIENNGRVVEKEQMIDVLWQDVFVEESSLSQNIFQLRKILGKSPTGANYIETISKRGYLFVAEVQEIFENNGGANGIAQTVPRSNISSLAVLPFTSLNRTAEDDKCLGLAMADAVINKLTGISSLKVTTLRTVLRYADRVDDLLNFARELDVDAVLDGTIQQISQKIRVSAHLVTTADGKTVWSGTFDNDLADIFSLQDCISEQLADALALQLTSTEKTNLKKHCTQDTRAYQAYLMGVFFSNKRTKEFLERSIGYFCEAIGMEPHFALAHARLADSYFWVAYNEIDTTIRGKNFELSREHALKAIEFDSSVAEAHAALGTVLIKHDRDPAGAEISFIRAIKADQNCAMAHSRYTYFLAAMGRITEALKHIRLAQEIDPLSPDTNAGLAFILYLLRDYDEAIRYCRIAIDLEPGFAEAALTLGRCLEQQHQFADAEAQYAAIQQSDNGETEAAELLCHVYAITGRKAMAQDLLSEIFAHKKGVLIRPYNVAAILQGLGRSQSAVEWSKKPYVNWTESLRMLRFDPRLDTLRNHAAFIIDNKLSSKSMSVTS